MKKLLTVFGVVLLFLSAQITFAQSPPEDTIEISQDPVIPLIKTRPLVRTPVNQSIANFSYELVPGGEITAASIGFPWSGRNLNKLSKLDLYLDNVLVLDFGAYLSGLTRAEKKALQKSLRHGGVVDFSLDLDESEFAALEDGQATLTLVGQPRLFRSLQLGEVTLRITDPTGVNPPYNPPPPDDPPPGGVSTPEPATMLLLGLGLIGLAGYGRKKFKSKSM